MSGYSCDAGHHVRSSDRLASCPVCLQNEISRLLVVNKKLTDTLAVVVDLAMEKQ